MSFSKAAENNKQVVLEQLMLCVDAGDRVLEIASGTGQHAIHFTKNISNLTWQPTDVDLDRYELIQNLKTYSELSIEPPFVLDIDHWPNLRPKFDAVYSANCLHIVGEEKLLPYVVGAAQSLKPNGFMILYGPFKYGGEFTTQSNAKFDQFLRETYPGSGIRDFERVDELAQQNGFTLVKDVSMPANNQFLVWQKVKPL